MFNKALLSSLLVTPLALSKRPAECAENQKTEQAVSDLDKIFEQEGYTPADPEEMQEMLMRH